MRDPRTDQNGLDSPSGPQPVRLALRPKQAAIALDMSERKLWELANRGVIPSVRIDGVRLFPVDSLRQWLADAAGRGGDQ